ncbi:D-alanine--D-alanine ligase family protein [Streptomyces sp. 8N706]|uniref:D-alanine--D-alanine ligase family protein n=1 Tax=Streptomyces sp. 8N706 TaxID=3457416 RepID=UPI003FD1E22B
MHKPTFKQLATSEGLDTPRWLGLNPALSPAAMASTVHLTLGWPVFFKPSSGGGSLDAAVVHSQAKMIELLQAAREHPYEQYMVEEYVTGRPCTVGLLEIDGKLTTLPVLDVQTDREFYDYTAKHDPAQRTEHCPSILPEDITGRLQRDALRAHRMIGAHGLSRVDFMVTPSGRTAMLESNTLPGLSHRGNLATMAAAVGITYPDLICHVLETAFTKPRYLP